MAFLVDSCFLKTFPFHDFLAFSFADERSEVILIFLSRFVNRNFPFVISSAIFFLLCISDTLMIDMDYGKVHAFYIVWVLEPF